MSKIKLTGRGYDTFSSYMGTVLFENGVSVDHVSKAEMNRIGALTRIELVNEDGSEGEQAGNAAEMVKMRSQGAPVLKPMKRDGDDTDLPTEQRVEDVQIGAPQSETNEVDEATQALNEAIASGEEIVEPTNEEPTSEPAKIYTAKELEEIADKDGMAGLREIGDALEVKDTSIAGLMEKILAKQEV